MSGWVSECVSEWVSEWVSVFATVCVLSYVRIIEIGKSDLCVGKG